MFKQNYHAFPQFLSIANSVELFPILSVVIASGFFFVAIFVGDQVLIFSADQLSVFLGDKAYVLVGKKASILCPFLWTSRICLVGDQVSVWLEIKYMFC